MGVTDWDWYQFLCGRGATEVNFWQPSGAGFGAIPPGAPFLFKTKAGAPQPNRIVGGGFFSHWVSLPMHSAWEIFGEENGCASYAEMQDQAEPGERLGWSRQMIAKIEAGDRAVAVRELPELCRALECGVLDLLGRAEGIDRDLLRLP